MKKLTQVISVIALSLSILLTTGCDIIIGTVPPGTTAPAVSPTALQPGFTVVVPGGGSAVALPSIADAVAKVKPSVVAINVEIRTNGIFGPITEEGAGSGWIIDPSGIIVTNNHVVEGATRVTIVTDDGRSFEADPKNIAADPLSDLAVIKIDATGLPAAKVGDSKKLRVGDWVVAIGNSLGQGIRATVGIVSQQSVSVDVDGQTLTGLIETDAAINPGNSGGPLVNMAAEVIGINSVKIAQVGIEGVGYAIGTGEAAPIIQQLVSSGKVTRPFLGVTMDNINATYTTRYGLTVSQGALILQVVAGGPAAEAGLKTGDVVIRFNEQEIVSPDTLRKAIHQAQIGQSIEITYQRGSSQAVTRALLQASP